MSFNPAPAEAQLWNVLRAYLRQTCALFGDPADIARGLFLTRLQHQHICEWLRPLEALVRRLLYLLARTRPTAPTPKRAEAKLRSPRTMKASGGACFDTDNSEAWRVSFNVLPQRRKAAPARTPHPHIQTGAETTGADPDRISAAPIAMRLEALIRVVINPEPHADKLARRLTDEEPPYTLLDVPRSCTGPLYAPAREASLLICQAIGGAVLFSDSS